MGRVWRAHDQQLGVDVAIKEVVRRPGIPDDHWSELLVRARREARHGARLRDHPNIVAVFDIVIEDAVPWTVMRLVQGTSLETRLKAGPLSVDEAQQVATAVLSALGAAHAARIIHRDVKPANILLADDGGLLLTDFGIAVNDADTKITQDGGIIGSMAYIAPERADGHQGNEASDLFSLGATLYQATEGTSPFQRDTLTGTLRAVAFHEPPPPARAGHLAPLITALLSKEPAGRPTVAEALAMATAATTTVPAPRKPKATATLPDAGAAEGEPAYDVVLKAAGGRKIQVIKTVSALTGSGLKDAKDLVDGAPRPVLTTVDRNTAAEAEAALVEAGATAVVRRNRGGAAPAATVKSAGPQGAKGRTGAGAPTARTVKDAGTEPTGPGAQDSSGPRNSARPGSAARRTGRRSRWVKILAGVAAVAAATTAGLVIYQQTRPGLQAADLLQKIDVARFAGVQTTGVYEWTYGAPNNLCRKGPDGGSDWSEHEWGDPSVTGCPSPFDSGTWHILVDLSHYGSRDESALDSATSITQDQQHGNATALGYSYHAVTAPSGMTAMATTAYSYGSHHTRQDLEIVDGAYRVHVEVELADTPGQPPNDISQIAELIFKRMPAPPATAH